MCTRTVCALATVFEAAGLATVGLSLVRGQAEASRAPRMLHCQFPLGRPLGRPGDAAFQHDVLDRAFSLLARQDVPVLEDHPEVIDDLADEQASCPLPPRHDPDLPPAVDEARGLRPAYDRSFVANGRTMMGRIGGPDDIEELLGTFLRLADGATLADVGWEDATLHAAAQDVRAYYEEAGLALSDVNGARQIESWFYDRTAAGTLLRDVQDTLKEADPAAFLTWYYVVPGTQART